MKSFGRMALGAPLAGHHEWANRIGMQRVLVGSEGSRTAGAGFAGFEFVGSILFSKCVLCRVL